MYLNNSYSFSKNSLSSSQNIDISFLTNRTNRSNLSKYRLPLFSQFDKFKERRPHHHAIGKKKQKNTAAFSQSVVLKDDEIEEEVEEINSKREDDPHSIQKYVFGYMPKYEVENRNLNVNRQLIEEYKYFQDKNLMTRMNFAKNLIVPNKNINQEGNQINILQDSNVYEKDVLYVQQKRYEESSRVDFYKNFKQIDHINDEYQFFNEKPDYSSTYLNNLTRKRLSPSPSGLIRNQLNQVHQVYLGSNRMQALIDSYEMMPDDEYPEVINFCDNNFSQEIVCSLINTFKKRLAKLILKGNRVSISGAKVFSEKMKRMNDRIKLTYVDLSNTKLGDNGGAILIERFAYLRKLTYVNISDNSLRSSSAQALYEWFESSNSIESLYIHNNGFNANNLKNFLNSINNYSRLITLDLSWNNIGSNSEILKKFFVNLGNNTTLIHLDISHNQINYADVKDISTSLNGNHTLAGLHLNGNDAFVDADGYIRPINDVKKMNSTYSSVGLNPYAHYNGNNRRNCWICEKWVPVELVLSQVLEPVFIHLEFMEYQPWFLPSDGSDDWKVTVMFPPGEWKYFYTTCLKNINLDNESKMTKLVKPLNFKFVYDIKKPKDTTMNYEVAEMNIIEINEVDNNLEFYTLSSCKPRRMTEYVYENSQVGWSEYISIWNKWIKDESETYVKMFDNDWALVGEKLVKAIKEDDVERQKIKTYLRPKYKTIRYFYKYFASHDVINNVWCIPEQRFYDVFTQLDMFDAAFSKDMIPIIFRETIISDKNNFGQLSPQNGCIRHQFINMLLKVIIRKYKLGAKSKISYSKGVQNFLETYGPEMDKFSPHVWRSNIYYIESVDMQLKKTKEFLNEVFMRFQVTPLPGEKPCITINEMMEILKATNLLEYIQNETVLMCFNLALSNQVDETRSDAHLKMRHMLEFFECWTRLVFSLNFPMEMTQSQQRELGITTSYPECNYDELSLEEKLWVVFPHLLSIFNPKSDKDLIENMKKLIMKQKFAIIKDLKFNETQTKLSKISLRNSSIISGSPSLKKNSNKF